MKEYNFKASDNNGEMLVGLGFSFSFMGVAGLILMLRLVLFPKIKYSSYVNNIYLEKFFNSCAGINNNSLCNEVNKKKYAIKKLSHIWRQRNIKKYEKW